MDRLEAPSETTGTAPEPSRAEAPLLRVGAGETQPVAAERNNVTRRGTSGKTVSLEPEGPAGRPPMDDEGPGYSVGAPHVESPPVAGRNPLSVWEAETGPPLTSQGLLRVSCNRK